MRTDPPVELADLRQRVEKALDAHLSRQRQRLDPVGVELGGDVDALQECGALTDLAAAATTRTV